VSFASTVYSLLRCSIFTRDSSTGGYCWARNAY